MSAGVFHGSHAEHVAMAFFLAHAIDPVADGGVVAVSPAPAALPDWYEWSGLVSAARHIRDLRLPLGSAVLIGVGVQLEDVRWSVQGGQATLRVQAGQVSASLVHSEAGVIATLAGTPAERSQLTPGVFGLLPVGGPADIVGAVGRTPWPDGEPCPLPPA